MSTSNAQRIGFYSGILIDAVESGAVEWARVRNYEWKDQSPNGHNSSSCNAYIIASAQLLPDDPEYVKVPMWRGRYVIGDYTKVVEVYYILVREGLNKILSKEVKASDWIIKACKQAKKEWDGSYIDAICADAILQAAVFEEIIYG